MFSIFHSVSHIHIFDIVDIDDNESNNNNDNTFEDDNNNVDDKDLNDDDENDYYCYYDYTDDIIDANKWIKMMIRMTNMIMTKISLILIY